MPQGAESQARVLLAEDVLAFARDELLDPGRRVPIVGLTTRQGESVPLLDANALARDVSDKAVVVVLETGDATWALSDALPPLLDVYGGAARIWRPNLTTTSDPAEHPLMFIWRPGDAVRVFERIVRDVTGIAPRRSRETMSIAPGAILATVESLAGATPMMRRGDACGPLAEADLPMATFRETLVVGMELPVRIIGREADGTIVYSAQGTLPSWGRVSNEYAVGDVVHGRVGRIEDGFVLVDLLPGARGIVPLRELDWVRFKHPNEVVVEGEWVAVEVVELAAGDRRCTLSLKRGRMREPRPPISVVDGGLPFGPSVDEGSADTPLRDRIDELEHEVGLLRAERQALLDRHREVRKRHQLLQQSVRSGERLVTAPGADPFAHERALLRAVRIQYAESMGESDRQEFPLERMRVGREFLQRARALDGVSPDKVVEACMQVACQRAHKINARRVHRLREGSAGAPYRVRGSDHAVAWRCSLQDNSPAARRLHWWDIPGENGRTIEFASVATHDDMSIPE